MILYLHALQSPINIGMILRSAEVFEAEVWIYDRYSVLCSDEARRTISDFACGAAERLNVRMLDMELQLPVHEHRIIATTIDSDAQPLSSFAWQADDIVCIGNEYDGISDTIAEKSDIALTIRLPNKHLPKPPSYSPIDPSRRTPPTNDGRPSLNTAVATSIILLDWYQKS
ncbi:TrmH family RNA methyltransferase [Primorskyibacter flagellatus]|uniref:TrmH family RNA methyltransferase n=1 Tax=Primorskyibacter flagellatus TaxID=1387277 RepID=UPI0009FBA752|nr:TrmH family RNA methyltransferase [Primorskyibacter flagellatus]